MMSIDAYPRLFPEASKNWEAKWSGEVPLLNAGSEHVAALYVSLRMIAVAGHVTKSVSSFQMLSVYSFFRLWNSNMNHDRLSNSNCLMMTRIHTTLMASHICVRTT